VYRQVQLIRDLLVLQPGCCQADDLQLPLGRVRVRPQPVEGLGAQRGQGTLRSGEVLLQLGGQPQMARGAPRFRPRDGVVAAGAAFRWGHRSASTSSSPHPNALPGPTPSASSRVSASWLVTVAVPANATRVRVMGLL